MQIQPYSSTTWWNDILKATLPAHLKLIDLTLNEYPINTSEHWGKLEVIQDTEDQELQSYNEYLQSFIDEGNIFEYDATQLEDCTLFMAVASVLLERQGSSLFAQIEIPLVVDQAKVSGIDVVELRTEMVNTIKDQLDELVSDIPELFPHRLN